MLRAAFIILLTLPLHSNLLFGNDWYENWPKELFADTEYFRGQRTNLASFDEVLDMIVNEKSNKVISSRMFRTLEKIYPLATNEFRIEMTNRQIEYYKNEKLLWWIADCHADPYMCHLPPIKKLIGDVFLEAQLPSYILEKLKQENGEQFDLAKIGNKSKILEFFDPVVSTSYRIDIARSFARDKDGEDGYILILNDLQNRNCSAENKRTANCFINNEEFMEEMEFPIWGYVLPSELNGIIVDHLEVRKLENGLVRLRNIKSGEESLYEKGKFKSCQSVKKIKSKDQKIRRFKLALIDALDCK